jgi:hypothetical protein
VSIRYVSSDSERLAIHLLEDALAADDLQFLPMGVVGEGFDDVAARMHEVLMQPLHHIRVLYHRFGHEGAGLEVAATLQFEEIALGANDMADLQPFEKTALGVRFVGRAGIASHLFVLSFVS